MIAEHVGLAHELIAVLVGQVDVERELGHLLRLDQRQLGDLPVLPLHAVDEEVLPHPVGAVAGIGEVVAGDRRLDGLAAGELEAELGGVAGDVLRLDRLLVRLVGLMIADDLLDRDAALGGDLQRFLGDVAPRLLVVLDGEDERRLDRLHADEEVAALRADVGDVALARGVDAARLDVAVVRQRCDRRRGGVAARHDDGAEVLAAHERQRLQVGLVSLGIERLDLRGRVVRPIAGEGLVEARDRRERGGVGPLHVRAHGAVGVGARDVEEDVGRLRRDDGPRFLRGIILDDPGDGLRGVVGDESVNVRERRRRRRRRGDDFRGDVEPLGHDREALDRVGGRGVVGAVDADADGVERPARARPLDDRLGLLLDARQRLFAAVEGVADQDDGLGALRRGQGVDRRGIVERDFFEQWDRRRRQRCDSARAEGTLLRFGRVRGEDEKLQKDEGDRGFLHGVDGA